MTPTQQIKTVFIPCAGKGERMIPITKGQAKELLDLGDKKVIDHAIEEALGAGFSNVFIGINKEKTALKQHLVEKYDERCRLDFIPIEPNGFCDAIWHAKSIVDKDWFAIILPDMVLDHFDSGKPAISQLIDSWSRTGKPTIGLYPETNKGFGSGDIIHTTPTNDGHHLVSFDSTSKEPKSPFKVFGRYILPPGSCSFAIQAHNRETPMLDAIQKQSGMMQGIVMQGSIFDTGSPDGYQVAREFFEKDTEKKTKF